MSLVDLLRYLTQLPARQRGARHVQFIREEADCLLLQLKADSPLIQCPKVISRTDLSMLISEQLNPRDWHYYQIQETRLTPDDVVLDCGACEGLFTGLAWKCRAVYSIEPSRYLAGYLQRSFAGCPNIQVVQCCLSDTVGSIQFTDDGICSRPSETGDYSVPLTTLDALCAGMKISPTYLKADLEGYEIKMLHGARQIIRDCRPKIAITTYHDKSHAEAIRRFLLSINPDYKIKWKGLTPAGCPVMLHAYF